MRKLIVSDKYVFRSKYYADSEGHIWSESKKDFLSEDYDKDGYKKVCLMTKDKPAGKGHRFSVHRLILSTFCPIENMNLLQVDHIDGNRENNKLENLRWTTCAKNINNPNTAPCRRINDQDGLKNASSKFTKEDFENFILDCQSGKYTKKDIMAKYNICRASLQKIINGETYKEETSGILETFTFKSDYSRDVNGAKNPRAKLSEKQVLEIIDLLLSKIYSLEEIAKQCGVSKNTIYHIKNNDTWKKLTQSVDFS